MESDSPRLIDTETGGQQGGTAATPPERKPGGPQPATAGSASKQKRSGKRTEQTALQKEQRKAAAAQAAVEELQRRLAAVEAALAEERQQAADAQRALAEQRPTTETHPETPAQPVEQMPAGGALLSASCRLLAFAAWISSTSVARWSSRRSNSHQQL